MKPGTLSGEGDCEGPAEPATTTGTPARRVDREGREQVDGAADPPAEGLARAATVPTPPRARSARTTVPAVPHAPAGRWLVVAAVRSPVVDPAEERAHVEDQGVALPVASKYAFEGVLCGAVSFRTMYVVAPVFPAEFTPAFRKSVDA